jgi:hypothetical protein
MVLYPVDRELENELIDMDHELTRKDLEMSRKYYNCSIDIHDFDNYS